VNNSATVGGGGGSGNSHDNKSLENTLRNRKIILSSGLKRAHDLQGGGADNGGSSNIVRKQIIFAKNSNINDTSVAISDL
jgi:hypothetical protein